MCLTRQVPPAILGAVRDTTLRHRQALFRDALHVIGDAPVEALTLDGVAREIATSRRQLQRVFEDIAGLGFREVLVLERMVRAVRLLEAGHPPAAVSRQLGYSHQSHFARTFKRHHGMPPGQWSADRRPDTGAPLRVVDRLYAALREAALPVLLSLIAQDARWSVPGPGPDGGRLHGRGSVLAWLAMPPPTTYELEVTHVERVDETTVRTTGRHVHRVGDERRVLEFVHTLTIERGLVHALDERLAGGVAAARQAVGDRALPPSPRPDGPRRP